MASKKGKRRIVVQKEFETGKNGNKVFRAFKSIMSKADQHHCPECGGIFGSKCKNRGHMTECPIHPDCWFYKKDDCIKCHAEWQRKQAEERRERKSKERDLEKRSKEM